MGEIPARRKLLLLKISGINISEMQNYRSVKFSRSENSAQQNVRAAKFPGAKLQAAQ